MNKFIKEIPRAIIITFVIFIVLLIIRLISSEDHIDTNYIKMNFFFTFIYGLSLYFTNFFIFELLNKFFSNDIFNPKRVAIGFSASFLFSLFVIFLLRIYEEVIIKDNSLEVYFANEKPANFVIASIVTFIVTLMIYAFNIYKAYQDERVKEHKIIAGTASAKFESLKNQIDPHFLFNSLNVLSSLIEENPSNAQQFTTKLSKIYRYVLDQKDKELVTVQEELKFAKDYMELLKMRFEDSITYEVPENYMDEEAKVVPLSLQLLLENTIKHNIVSENKPLHIRIFIKNGSLVIENNLQKKETLSNRKGVGLTNILSRYKILSDRKVEILELNNKFIVRLPILTKVVYYNSISSDSELVAYNKARRRVTELKEFYGNLTSYCIVIPILIFINLKTSPNFHWFWFSAFGWGFGLCMHAFKVFGFSSRWEENQVKKIMEKNSNKQMWK
jgi:sensor histidine kinase YesM